MHRTILASILLILAATIFTTEPHAKEKELCLLNSTREQIQCLSDVLKKTEIELDVRLPIVRERFQTIHLNAGPEADEWEATKLKQFNLSQKTWQTYVEQTCDGIVWSMWDGGTAQMPLSYRCKIELTQQRIRALDRIFMDPMGLQLHETR